MKKYEKYVEDIVNITLHEHRNIKITRQNCEKSKKLQ